MDMSSTFCDSSLTQNNPFLDTTLTPQLPSPSSEPDVDWTVFENADRYLLRDDNAWIARLGKEFWWNLECMTDMIITEHTTNTLQQQNTTGQSGQGIYNRVNNSSHNSKNVVNFNASHAQPSSVPYANRQPTISSPQLQVASTAQHNIGNLNSLNYHQPPPQLQPPSSTHYNNQHHFNNQQANTTQYNGSGNKTTHFQQQQQQQTSMNNSNFMPRKIIGQRNQSSNNSSMNSGSTPINNNYHSSSLFNSDTNHSTNGASVSPAPSHSSTSSSSSSTISAYSAITRPNGGIAAAFSNNSIPDNKLFHANTNNNNLFQAFASTFNDQLPMDSFNFNPFKSNISFDNNTWQQQPITNWQ
ncbi:unnamed protein product [Didymodactylos carnosus]|uniref:Uncharacterized protein n=1 Tax=Didymodactylos carnosus TaxID=1234261 RepID=A0A813QDA7_9BILA|nr:unnamed protein product [Didymodactylos carnosus]CAF0832839.1 unnamed protein product [Didymodactylos carnosus]CAF3546766.1 unnamed protein product [Didymodactylos carnosus]CAF3617500.1 unnamed protein product [Didymodactylos carnosus]